MNTRASEQEWALRWLMTNRRPGVSIEQAFRVLSTMIPLDLAATQVLKRIAAEEESKQTRAPKFNWRMPPGRLPPRA